MQDDTSNINLIHEFYYSTKTAEFVNLLPGKITQFNQIGCRRICLCRNTFPVSVRAEDVLFCPILTLQAKNKDAGEDAGL